MRIIEVVRAKGHVNVKATHGTTLEVTTENYLTSRGDCIIAVNADKSPLTLSEEFKAALRKDGSRVRATISVGDLSEEVRGWGSAKLTLTSPVSMVFRKSRYIDPRTVMVGADKSAADLSRELVSKLRDPRALVTIMIEVETP